MSELAIGFLVIGALFFVGSFFLQEKLSSSDMDEIKGLGEKEMKSILESNVKKANEQIASLLEEKLEDKVKELKLKMSSLDFIQEIISAKEISTNDAKKLYKSIDVFEAFIKGKFMELRSFLFLTYNYGWGESHGKQGLDESKRYFGIRHCRHHTFTHQ